ncbi:MOSC domain-containing protein [soil metagenome]
MATLLAACVVHELRRDAGYYGVTGIDKRPVNGNVKVTKYGLRGDIQADRKHHGGLLQAVYAYSAEDAAFWEAELGRELPSGWFGENLRVDGLDVSRAQPGERWRIGSGEKPVELEVTVPRNPCTTFARWVGGAEADGWVKRFADADRLGMYLRVMRTGSIAAGDEIEVVV